METTATVTRQNAQQIEFCERPESSKRQWLTEHVLIPLEDNYRQTLTERQIGFWLEFFTDNRWTCDEILATLRFVLRDCKFMPTAHEWAERRPKHDNRPEFLNETPAQTVERLSGLARGWGKVCMELTLWGLKSRGPDNRNRMPDAYDKLIEAAKEWRRPQDEVDAFAGAKKKTLEMRALNIERERNRGKRNA